MPWIQPSPQCKLRELLPPEFLDIWQTLAMTTDQGDPYSCGPIWNLAYHDVFSPDAPIFYAYTERSALIFTRRDTPAGFELLPIDSGWMFGEPLLGAGAPILLLRQLPEIIMGSLGRLAGIYITGIRRSSDLAKIIFECYGRFADLYSFEPWRNASASLVDGVDGWLGRRSANFRANLRKASRKAQALGVYFERVMPATENWADIYERMLHVESQSWKGCSDTGITHSPEKEFYASMMKYMAERKEAYVIFAKKEDRDIGFIFGGIAGKLYRGQQFSYIKSMAAYSIGNLLQYEKVKWLAALGVLRYDLGSGTGEKMAYKRHWAEDFQQMETWLISNRSISSS